MRATVSVWVRPALSMRVGFKIQRYVKSSAETNRKICFCRDGVSSAEPKVRISEGKSKPACILPSGSIFDEVKGTNKRGQKQARCQLKMESGKLKMRGAGRSRRRCSGGVADRQSSPPPGGGYGLPAFGRPFARKLPLPAGAVAPQARAGKGTKPVASTVASLFSGSSQRRAANSVKSCGPLPGAAAACRLCEPGSCTFWWQKVPKTIRTSVSRVLRSSSLKRAPDAGLQANRPRFSTLGLRLGQPRCDR